jgi:hypothetical protein
MCHNFSGSAVRVECGIDHVSEAIQASDNRDSLNIIKGDVSIATALGDIFKVARCLPK